MHVCKRTAAQGQSPTDFRFQSSGPKSILRYIWKKLAWKILKSVAAMNYKFGKQIVGS